MWNPNEHTDNENVPVVLPASCRMDSVAILDITAHCSGNVAVLVLASCGFDGQCPNLNLVPMPARIIWIAEDTLVANDYLPEAKMRCDPAISVG